MKGSVCETGEQRSMKESVCESGEPGGIQESVRKSGKAGNRQESVWESGKPGGMQESVCDSGESVKVFSLRALRARAGGEHEWWRSGGEVVEEICRKSVGNL